MGAMVIGGRGYGGGGEGEWEEARGVVGRGAGGGEDAALSPGPRRDSHPSHTQSRTHHHTALTLPGGGARARVHAASASARGAHQVSPGAAAIASGPPTCHANAAANPRAK